MAVLQMNLMLISDDDLSGIYIFQFLGVVKNIYRFIIIGFLSLIGFELFLKFSPFSYGITPMTYDKDIGMWHKRISQITLFRVATKRNIFLIKRGLKIIINTMTIKNIIIIEIPM